jgi:hypothetical protein
MTEFFAQGGTTKFVDRLSAVLNIHASTIKIVQVWEGSTNIVYSITPTDIPNADMNQVV